MLDTVPRTDRRSSQRPEAGPPRLAGADGGGGRARDHPRRRARRGDRRHRRHLPAYHGGAGGDVRRHPRLPARPPRGGEHPHLGAADQSHPRHAGRHERDGPRALLARLYEEPRDHSASHRRRRAPDGERRGGKRHRHPQNPDAEMARARRRPLHRHRLHGDHAAPRHRLDQLRRLPRPGPGPRCRLDHDVEGQARQPDHAALARARKAVPDRGRVAACIRRCSWWRGSRFRTARTSTTLRAA